MFDSRIIYPALWECSKFTLFCIVPYSILFNMCGTECLWQEAHNAHYYFTVNKTLKLS